MSMHEMSELLSASAELVRRIADAEEQALLLKNLEVFSPRLKLDAGIDLGGLPPQPELHVYDLGFRIMKMAAGEQRLDIAYGWCAFLLNFWGWMPQESAYSAPAITKGYLPRMREIWKTHDFSNHIPWHPTLTVYPLGTNWFTDEHNNLIRRFFDESSSGAIEGEARLAYAVEQPSDDPTAEQARHVIEQRVALGQLPRLDPDSVEAAYIPLCQSLAKVTKAAKRPHVIAIVGAPGSGKTTLSAYFQVLLPEVFGLSVAAFSLDDLYLSRADRQQLATNVHPLFAARGAPGTHRIELGMRTIKSLREAAAHTKTLLPRFNKRLDDTRHEAEWPVFIGRPDVILIDSWMWNVVLPTPEQLAEPYNQREREADSQGIWRQTATQALERGYPEFFAQANQWVLLETPDWDTTVRFREEQEAGIRASLPQGSSLSEEECGVHEDESSIRHFLALFQRWAHLPHTREPDYRIRFDDSHRATLVE